MLTAFTLLSPAFYLYAVVFIISIFFSLTLPGYTVLRVLGAKVEDKILRIVFATTVGLVLFGFFGYLFGYLHIRWATYIYLFLMTFFSWKVGSVSEIVSYIKKSTFVFSLPVIVGVISVLIQIFPVFLSGFMVSGGIKLFFLNAYDGVLHLSFIQSMTKVFPPIEPGAFPLALTHYHIWSDFVIAELIRVWQLPILSTFFQFMPLTLALGTTIVSYKLVRLWGFSKRAGMLSLFFLTFSGNASFLVTYALHKVIDIGVSPAIDNGPTVFLNTPQAFARFLFLSLAVALFNYLKKRNFRFGILATLIASVIVGFKVYFGIFVAVGLVCSGLMLLIHDLFKKDIKSLKRTFFQLLVLAVIYGTLSFLVYYPTNKGAGGVFYAPLAWPKLLLAPDKLDFNDWWLRMQVYEQAKSIKGIVFLNTLAIIIFFISVFGTRLVGLFVTKDMVKKLGMSQYLFYFSGMIVSLFLGMNTIQVSGGFNVFNFFVVMLVPMSIFSAIFLDYLLSKKNIVLSIIVCLCLLLSIPRPISELSSMSSHYLRGTASNVVTTEMITASNYIRLNTKEDDIVQTNFGDGWDKETMLSPFLTDRSSYLSGIGMLESHNQPIDDRKKAINLLWQATSSGTLAKNAASLGIDYIVLYPDEHGNSIKLFDDVGPWYELNSIKIYKAVKD